MSIISLSYALTSAVIGIGMVFVFLCVLLVLMMLLNRIGEPKPAEVPGAVQESREHDELPEAVIAGAVLALMDDEDAHSALIWQSDGDNYSARQWKERKALESWRRRR